MKKHMSMASNGQGTGSPLDIIGSIFGGGAGSWGGKNAGAVKLNPPPNAPPGQMPTMPQANYWQGNNFIAPGLGGQQGPSSNIGQMFPRLQSILGQAQGPGPSPTSPTGATPPPGTPTQQPQNPLGNLQSNPFIQQILQKLQGLGGGQMNGQNFQQMLPQIMQLLGQRQGQ